MRKEVEEHFKSVGGEPLLYEINLTPSTIPMTYRQDILEADFILLIMKDNYGTETEKGLSGTHEEYRIAKENKIPIHVYLTSNQEQTNELVEELNRDGVSYYYFDSDEELVARIKETTFTIAKEILLNQLSQLNLDGNLVRKIVSNHDYYKSLEIIKIIENMK